MVRGKRLVFLVGAPRSGTTWLQLMLSRSERVATVNETHLFEVYLRSLIENAEIFRENPRAIGLRPLFSEAEYWELIRQVASAVLVRILATKPGADVILEKTPTHVNCWREILKVFPQASFLHLVRDPRAVVASLRVASKTWGKSWASPRLIANCAMWSTSVTEGKAIAGATKNYLEVRYEDLREEGVNTLLSIFEWMGVESSSGECLELLQDTSIDKLRSGNVKNAPWDMATEPQGFYREGGTASWRSVLSEREIFLVEAEAKELMAALGYRPEAPRRPLYRIAHVGQVVVLEHARAALRSRAVRLGKLLVFGTWGGNAVRGRRHGGVH